jgi:hypothetical protein
MSIDVQMKKRLRQLVRTRDLIGLPRLYLGDQRKRCVLVTRHIAGDIMGPHGELPVDERLAQLRGDLDGFAMGEAFTIARKPLVKPPDTDLSPLHPVTSRVWDFRVCEPPEGIRCAGFFAGKDIFVALIWEHREKIQSEDWSELISDCQGIWDSLFNPLMPHFGEIPHAYISKPFSVV